MEETRSDRLPLIEELEWHWFQGKDVKASVLQSVCMFRSRVLFDRGFRGQFSSEGALYGDVNYTDFESFHITASRAGQLIGTVRVTPPTAPNVARTVLGAEKYAELLAMAGVDPMCVLEINRLMIDESRRCSGLGRTLMYAAMGLIETIFERDAYFILGSAGNCTKQADFFLKYTDYTRIEGAADHFSIDFNDHISFLKYGHPPYAKGAAEIEWFKTGLIDDSDRKTEWDYTGATKVVAPAPTIQAV